MALKSALKVSEKETQKEQEFLRKLDLSRLPRHVGIIMDGNGRWAKQRGLLERIKGHEAGIDSVRTATRTAAELGIKVLSLYAFSKENWNRPKTEILALMTLLEKFLYQELDELHENNIRLVATGELSDLPASCQRALDSTTKATETNTGMVLNLALSYGGRNEIVNAARRIAKDAVEGIIETDAIDENYFSSKLYRPEIGDPDLIIRTSGEFRVSNFMIWQAAYSEFYITPTLWPDFTKALFIEALVDFQSRDRRFGGV